MRIGIAWAVASLMMLGTLPAAATEWYVDPDGPTPWIHYYLSFAVDGDTILLGNGTFSGELNRNVDFMGKRITIMSDSDDPSACVIDAGGAGRGFIFDSGEDATSVLRGVTIRSGHALDGGGVFIGEDASPTIGNCVFEDCWAENKGGGLYCASGSVGQLTDCEIRDCYSWNPGGGLYAYEASLILHGCLFDGCIAGWPNGESSGGGISAGDCQLQVDDCEFVCCSGISGGAMSVGQHSGPQVISGCRFAHNAAFTGGALSLDNLSGGTLVEGCLFEVNNCYEEIGVVTLEGGQSEVRGCTFVGNNGGDAYATGGDLLIESTILFGTAWKSAIGTADRASITRICCNMFGGSYGGVEPENGNFSADPLFCDASTGNFTLRSDSPCLPGNHPDAADCGLIGAFGEGCPGPTAADYTSWGSVKTMFR